MTSPLTSHDVIDLLDLRPLAREGGFFRRTYALPGDPGSGSAGPQSSAILYLVTSASFSALHRLEADEIYHFHLGDPCELVCCGRDGRLVQVTMGSDIVAGQSVQQLVPGGSWQGLKVRAGGEFALLGTTMTPGFRSDAFELATSSDIEPLPVSVREVLRPFLAMAAQ